MSLMTAEVRPNKALGFFVLGASFHDISSRIKADPAAFKKLNLIYDESHPVIEPLILDLPANGIRLRFDGESQKLRLIEVTDFTKNKLTYNGKDIAKVSTSISSHHEAGGPDFKHVYSNLFGPTYPGEYIPPQSDNKTEYGTYVHSYPGLSFTFPILHSAWTDGKDHVELLSTPATRPASSMAVYYGQSWDAVRNSLYTMDLPDPRISLGPTKIKEVLPEEIGVVKLWGAGRLEMQKPRASSSYMLRLGLTTPQELVAELGPPDVIYRKSDQRMMIHKPRTNSQLSQHRPSIDKSRPHSSSNASADVSEEESDLEAATQYSEECFYNYFHHGFDILVSAPKSVSRIPPSRQNLPKAEDLNTFAPLVATKIILHGNVPGSYSFNRHRRSRWEIAFLPNEDVNSEVNFDNIARHLHEEWKSIYSSEEEAKQRQRGMVLNRGWGENPGSSCELLGGWEDSAGGRRSNDAAADIGGGLGTTTLFGFPGMVFEVLKNGCVSSLTVF